MTLICVSQRVEILPERNEVRDSIDQRLISFLSKSGGIVVPVPNFAHSEMEIENWLNNIRANTPGTGLISLNNFSKVSNFIK